MSEVSLQHGMARQMAASQSMQAGMQILQASALELKQLLRHALETNPMLEELPDASPEALEDGPDGDAWNEREDGWNEFTPEGRPSAEAAARRDFMYESVVAPESLKTHLTDQAQHSALTGRARDALFLLIDALDDRGFLTESPQELEERECFSMRDMEEALDVLRGMDPPGVGAADLRDSLLIQLEQRGLKRSLAFRLVKRCWRELAAHKYEEAARLLDVEPEAVAEALEVIRSLTPDPGCAYAPGGNPHLLPDVIVEEGPSGGLDVVLTSEYLPRLSMNERYMELMAESSGSRELRQYLRKAFREGQELLRALDMRQETVLRLARAIVRRQEDFFRFGPSRLKAMGMEEVAEEMGVHVSTVSRACRDKYLLCKWGMKELRAFFSAGVPAQMSRKRSSSPSLGKNMLTFHFRSSHSRIWRSASSRRISCITKSPASKLPRGLSWMAREKSSSPSAFFGGAVRMHTFPRSLQKGAVMTRSPGLIQARRVSTPAASVRTRLTCSVFRKEIWESTSNSRMDSISSSKNSRRTGWEDWSGKTSRMPPRRDHCPREMT